MKKKALISAIVSIALASAMCVSFAACDELPLTGAKNAKDIISDKVTAKQWLAAFEGRDEEDKEIYENFKLEIKANMVTEMVIESETLQANSERSATYIYADEKTHAKETLKTTVTGNIPESLKGEPDFKERDEESEYYVGYSNSDGWKYITKVDGNWAYTDSELEDGNSKFEKICYSIAGINGSLEYEDYEYNAEHNGYVVKNAKEGVLIVFKFKNEKLKAIYIERTTEDGDRKQTSTISYVLTYGGQSVKLPTVAN